LLTNTTNKLVNNLTTTKDDDNVAVNQKQEQPTHNSLENTCYRYTDETMKQMAMKKKLN